MKDKKERKTWLDTSPISDGIESNDTIIKKVLSIPKPPKTIRRELRIKLEFKNDIENFFEVYNFNILFPHYMLEGEPIPLTKIKEELLKYLGLNGKKAI